MTTSQNIISVGYILNIESIKDKIFELVNIADHEKEFVENEVYSGVFYSKSCRGGLYDVQKSQEDLQSWWSKRRGKEYSIGISTLYRNTTKAGVILAAEIQLNNESFFSFLYNKNNISTTIQKKQILNDRSKWEKINLSNKWIVPVKTYIHHS